jgi:hypothetical protein
MDNPRPPGRKVRDIGPPREADESLPADLELEPLPDELTGRAGKTGDDLGALFENETEEHLADGFNGGSGDESGGIP